MRLRENTSSSPRYRDIAAQRATARSSSPLRRRVETVDDVLNRLVNTAKNRTDRDFSDKLNSGQSFTSEYFCKQVIPELGIDISQSYQLPYDLDEKQFHDFIFKDIAQNGNNQLEQKVLDDMCELNPDLAVDVLRQWHHGNEKHILQGIASKYNTDDIFSFLGRFLCFRRGGNMNAEQEEAVTKVRNHFGVQMEFIPSPETAETIIEAMDGNI